jgi:hypothetical protein
MIQPFLMRAVPPQWNSFQAMPFGRAAVRRVHCPGALMRAKYRAASQVEA